jgi:hypothetical protein
VFCVVRLALEDDGSDICIEDADIDVFCDT